MTDTELTPSVATFGYESTLYMNVRVMDMGWYTIRSLFHPVSYPNPKDFSARLPARSSFPSSTNLEPLEQLNIILLKPTNKILRRYIRWLQQRSIEAG